MIFKRSHQVVVAKVLEGGVEIFLAEAREGKSFLHLLVDIIDLQGEFSQIDVEMTWCLCHRSERGQCKQEILVSYLRSKTDKKKS